MLESRDVLFLVLAVCATVFTVVGAWILIELLLVIRRVHRVLDDARKGLGKIEGAVLGLGMHLAESIRALKPFLTVVQTWREEKKKAARARTETED